MRRAAVLSCLLLASGADASAAAPRDWPRLRLGSPAAAHSVRRALDGAALRLRNARCRELFQVFVDQRGRPLRERLAELESDETSYLPLLVFADGSESVQCRSNGSLFAFTMRGSRVVFICERRFERAWHENPRRAEAVLIHEALHTLGLGEDPPSSHEITKRVESYCPY